jgi:hypothetical protein
MRPTPEVSDIPFRMLSISPFHVNWQPRRLVLRNVAKGTRSRLLGHWGPL